MELVTGRTGSPHVTSQQFRGILESIFGTQSYLANVYEKFSYIIEPGNIIQVKSGILIHHGGIFLVPNGSIDEIQYKNGTQGLKRIDLIVARYSKDADQNTESAEWVVIQGEETSGTPVAPAYNQGNMQNGDLIDDCPVYAIHYDGLNIEKLELLVPDANLGDGQWQPATLVNGATGNSNLGDGFVKYKVSNGLCHVVGVIDVNHQKDGTTYVQGLPRAKKVSYKFAPTSGTKIARLNVGRSGILNIEWIVNISDSSAYKGSTWIDISTTYEIQ